MFSLLVAIIYISFISLGLPDSLLGSGWPVMHIELDVPQSFAGILSMIVSIGTIISSLLSERFTKKFGTGGVTAVSVAMTAAALIGFSLSKEYWQLWFMPPIFGIIASCSMALFPFYLLIFALLMFSMSELVYKKPKHSCK